MSNSMSNALQEGQRLWYNGRPATLVSKDIDWDDNYRSRYRVKYVVRFDDFEGGRITLTEESAYALYCGIPYYEYSGFHVGDTMEIKRDGLDPNLRGTLMEINESAERYAYRVENIWFSYAELTKIHSITSRERSPRGIEVMKKLIAEKREELEALETALEVLEYATT